MLPALLLAVAPLAQGGADARTYRQLFDAGVHAFEAEDFERAKTLFEAAGERGTRAPLWRVYRDEALERARGTAADPAPSGQAPELVEWDTVRVLAGSTQSATLAATGDRLIYGESEAALIDVGSGELVARLRSRVAPQPRGGKRAEAPADAHVAWGFDTSGRVVVGVSGLWGGGVGLDVRDARTGRPLLVEGAATLDVTSGARFEWFPKGEAAPECAFEETIDLAAPEGVLRCHLIPLAGRAPRDWYAVLSEDTRFAMLRDQTDPTRMRIIDRRGERDVLERSPAGSSSYFSPDASRVVTIGDGELRCIDVESSEDRWSVKLDEVPDWRSTPAYTFLGQEFVVVAATGKVTAFDPDTGARRELTTLVPAPTGWLGGATFARNGSLLIVLDQETTLCYDARTGERRWAAGSQRWFRDPGQGTLDAAEELCLILDSRGVPQVVHLTDGTPAGDPAAPPLAVTSAVVMAGGDAVVLGLSNGDVRRVELADGRTSAVATHPSGWSRRVHPGVRGPNVLALAHDGSAQLLDATTLEVIAGAAPDPGEEFAAISRDGRFGVVIDREAPRTRILRFTEDRRGAVLHEEPRLCARVAYSPSGDRVALVCDGRVAVRDGHTGALVGEFDLPTDVLFFTVTFHREHELVLGTSAGDGEPYGARVVDTRDGKVIAALNVPDPFGGGTVMHIHSNVEHGLVILTSAQCGTVAAFDDERWEFQYELPTHGGNWGTLVVRHEPGASVAAISGMTPSHSRLFDVRTGKVLARAEVHGMEDLALAVGGRRVIGVRGQRLTVLDSETYETVYSREEAADGNAWLLRQGARTLAPGSGAPFDDTTHVIRDGWSAPISSFDAWLHDPLGLAARSLRALPELPVVLSVKGDSVKGDAPAPGVPREELSLLVRTAATPIGVLVERPDAPNTFVGLAARQDPADDPALEGAWRLRLAAIPTGWTGLRVVDETGVASRPHRPHRPHRPR
jgi:hypothetical protein